MDEKFVPVFVYFVPRYEWKISHLKEKKVFESAEASYEGVTMGHDFVRIVVWYGQGRKRSFWTRYRKQLS